MPTASDFSPEVLAQLKAQGINPEDLVEVQPQEMSSGRAALNTLKAHAGGIGGGGAGALAGAAAGEAVFPPGGGIPGALIGGIVGSLGGGYAGQKIQNAVLPEETTQKLQADASEAQKEHPIVSMATDIGASALASGGAFSPRTLLQAGRGILGKTALSEADELALQQIGREAVSPAGNATIADNLANSQALRGVALQSAINPAIDVGTSLATGNGLPSGRQLLGDVAGGALFGRQAGWAGKLTGHATGEQSPEPRYNRAGDELIGQPASEPYPEAPLKMAPSVGDTTIPPVESTTETAPIRRPLSDLSNLPIANEIIQKVIDKGATKPVSVKRIFPNLNLNDDEAAEILRRAQGKSVAETATETTAVESTKSEVPPSAPTTGPIDPKILAAKIADPNGGRLTTEENAYVNNLASTDPIAHKAFLDSVQQLRNNKTVTVNSQAPEGGSKSYEYSPEDLQKYNDIKGRMKELLDKGDFGGFTKLQQDFENVRNKYGGMPPLNKISEELNSQSINPKQNELLQNFYKAANEVAKRTQYGTREGVFNGSGFKAVWSNAFKRWDVARGLGKFTEGSPLKLGANEIMIRAKTGKDAELIAQHLPPLPLDVHSFENSPLNKDEQLPMSELIQRMQDFWQQKPLSTDVIKHTEKFMDFLRSPEQVNSDSGLNQTRVIAPPELAQHIQSGTATTGSVLQHLASSQGHPFQAVAEHLVKVSNPQDLKTPWTPAPDNVRSAYSYKPGSDINVVRMNPREMGNARVIIEEAVHSLTAQKLPAELNGVRGAELYNRMQRYIAEGPNESVKDLMRAYMATAKNMGIDKIMFQDVDYGGKQPIKGAAGEPDLMADIASKDRQHVFYAMGNLHEFLAHAFKNEQFQHLLNEMPSEVEGKTVWQSIVDAVKKLLGFDIKTGSMLDHVLRTGTDIASQERPGSIKDIGAPHSEEFSAMSQKENVRDNEEEIRPTALMGGVGKLFRGGLDTIRAIDHPYAKKVADGFQRVFETKDSNLGKQLNPIIESSKGWTARDDAKLVEVTRYEMENKRDAPETMFDNPRQRRVYEAAKASKELNFEERFKNEEPVYDQGSPRMPQRDPHYWQTTTNPDVANTIRQNTDKAAIENFRQIQFNYDTQKLGITPKGADKHWQDFVTAVQGNTQSSSVGNATFTNSARLAQGIPLAPELTRPGFLRNQEAYYNAQAIDNAYYKHIESNHEILAALGEKKDPWGRDVKPIPGGGIAGNTAVRNVVNELKGEVVNGLQGQVTKKAESLATATILGPQTEAHILVSNMSKLIAASDNPYQWGRVFAHAVSNIGEGWTHAKENGIVKMTSRSALDMVNSQLTWADRLAGLARGLRQIYTVGDLTTKLNYGLMQAGSESLIPYKIMKANEGDMAAMRLLRHLDTEWTRGKQYDEKGVQELASKFVGVLHGTHDARTLPSWLLHDNEISSFFKLASWGVAQTNSFMRDVWTPATEGNPGPLLNAVFGAAVGGMALKILREKIAGKKSGIPSLSEIGASSRGYAGNIPALAYNAMAAASYAGLGGFLSQAARWPFDAAFKNAPQGMTFPLDTVTSDIASTVHNVMETVMNDPNVNWAELGAHVMGHVITSDFQLGRIALNQGINSGAITGTLAERKLLSDKLGALRRFDMVEDIPYDAQDASNSNPYMNLEQKRFKMEQDPQAAMKMVPGLVQNIIQRYGNNPDVMLEKLKALKTNSYATFPSLDTTPLQFTKYISFLKKTQGDEGAQGALQDYMKHKIINEVKGSVVP